MKTSVLVQTPNYDTLNSTSHSRLIHLNYTLSLGEFFSCIDDLKPNYFSPYCLKAHSNTGWSSVLLCTFSHYKERNILQTSIGKKNSKKHFLTSFSEGTRGEIKLKSKYPGLGMCVVQLVVCLPGTHKVLFPAWHKLGIVAHTTICA